MPQKRTTKAIKSVTRKLNYVKCARIRSRYASSNSSRSMQIHQLLSAVYTVARSCGSGTRRCETRILATHPQIVRGLVISSKDTWRTENNRQSWARTVTKRTPDRFMETNLSIKDTSFCSFVLNRRILGLDEALRVHDIFK